MNSVASIRDKLIDLTIEEQAISEEDFYKISSVLSTQSRSPLKCHRLFGPQFSKFNPSFVSQIRQESDTLTPSEDVSDYRPV